MNGIGATDPVRILMGVHNGAPYLPAQLRSIAAQNGVTWTLTCNDDASSDESRSVITRFGQSHPGRVILKSGQRRGFSHNYLKLIAGLPECPGLVALADQDDVWCANKLRRAAIWLARVPAEQPVLYCARRWIWDGANEVRFGPDNRVKAPSFRNALVENIAPGNTIVLNAAAAALARTAARLTGPVFAHDWWLYLLISGAGGRILTDPSRVLFYRQHRTNAIGAGTGIRGLVARKHAVLRGVFRARIAGNIAAMQDCAAFLTPENYATLDRFTNARKKPFPARIWALGQVAPYRQSVSGSMGFWGAAALGKT
ncbi:glycosyltransferase [Roseovarius pelagicus]|uniref:Glycosyltransferase n=1 Tax=Roseovarius pelagicus TaxID=2980108 RepID=A0ABY6D7C7_9RHOB|nr:glycosyltransferase [Roseovarius pelagicus]UXX81819.1 glycosyltransferase [Roseovarius pelagicus]